MKKTTTKNTQNFSEIMLRCHEFWLTKLGHLLPGYASFASFCLPLMRNNIKPHSESMWISIMTNLLVYNITIFKECTSTTGFFIKWNKTDEPNNRDFKILCNQSCSARDKLNWNIHKIQKNVAIFNNFENGIRLRKKRKLCLYQKNPKCA